MNKMELRDVLKLLMRPIFFIVRNPISKNEPMIILDVTPTFRHAKKIAGSHRDSVVLIGFKVGQ